MTRKLKERGERTYSRENLVDFEMIMRIITPHQSLHELPFVWFGDRVCVSFVLHHCLYPNCTKD